MNEDVGRDNVELVPLLRRERGWSDAFEEVVQKATDGTYTLADNPGGDVIVRDTKSGKYVQGSGRPAHSDVPALIRQAFYELAVDDFPIWHRALMKAVREGSPQAMKVWRDTAMGVPDKVASTGNEEAMRALMEKLISTQATVEVPEALDVEVRTPD